MQTASGTQAGGWAYACMLAGGVIIVVGGLASALMMAAFRGTMGYGMMGDYAAYATSGWLAGGAWWMGAVGVATGGVVLYAAYRLRRDASQGSTAGTLAIVGGALSLLAMGGWMLGALLSIVGGALSLGRPRSA